jgi:hypothetical protein
MGVLGLDSYALEQGQVAGCCEHGNEHRVRYDAGHFLAGSRTFISCTRTLPHGVTVAVKNALTDASTPPRTATLFRVQCQTFRTSAALQGHVQLRNNLRYAMMGAAATLAPSMCTGVVVAPFQCRTKTASLWVRQQNPRPSNTNPAPLLSL